VSELKRLERLKREFVAALSHELRTPLTAIKGYVETLLEEQGESPHPYLGIIARHTERLILLARDLLTLSELEERPQDIAREVVDLRRLLDDVLALFTRRIAEKGLTLARPAGPGTEKVLVTGDPARLDQLLINLIDNAVKYTDRGGITLALTAGATETCLEVIDSGVGIPAEALPRIFDRFFVVDRSRSRQSGGTGLGLSIVKHIVQQHGGRLEVESQPGRGSTFRVILPSAGSPA
ncbi:MAG TPA: ATP-binding protein, partial [Candidatus Aminicenantes bacterium]|nr:ATP-binding protein [Candidatus Aminicenantes bacterium]